MMQPLFIIKWIHNPLVVRKSPYSITNYKCLTHKELTAMSWLSRLVQRLMCANANISKIKSKWFIFWKLLAQNIQWCNCRFCPRNLFSEVHWFSSRIGTHLKDFLISFSMWLDAVRKYWNLVGWERDNSTSETSAEGCNNRWLVNPLKCKTCNDI